MPFYFKESDILPRVAGLKSVLIVPCRFCPAASQSVRENKPYLELFRKFLRTDSYELFIMGLKRRLEDEGIKTSVFDSKLPHQFVACMWTYGRRRKFAEHAAAFEGLVVLGCDGMEQGVLNLVKAADCRVINGLEIEGLMNTIPTLSFPFNISLKLQGVTPVIMQKSKG